MAAVGRRHTVEYEQAREGALNLLRNCVAAGRGDTVLLVGEEGPDAFFDAAVCDLVAEGAREIGAEPSIVIVSGAVEPHDLCDDMLAAMEGADHTVFFARLGDRMRFAPQRGAGSKTMCYVRDPAYLADEFARAPHGLYVEVLDRLMHRMTSASRYRITCPLGTDLRADVPPGGSGADAVAAEFSTVLFPVMTFAPLSCATMSGRLAVGRWLMSTAVRSYEDRLLDVGGQVFAAVEKGRIEGFSGPQADVARIEDHFRAVATQGHDDAFALNSWHAGTYPKTFYAGNPRENIESWADIVFGSPRYTHFHACGSDPGDICLSVFDATISFDDEVMWDAGRFAFLDREDMQALKASHAGAETAYDMVWDIGV